MENFIGRSDELQLITSTVNGNKSTITVIYGRRRVGKSALVRQALQGKRAYYFEGLENQSKANQIQNFLSQLHFQSQDDQPPQPPRFWRDAFKLLLPFCSNQEVVIVLDEFQWMANYRSEIVSDLKMVWDQYLSQSGKVHLILCGSIASFMIKKVIASKALYGRVDTEIHLQPFSLSETTAMLKSRSTEEIMTAQMLVGGIPKYLDLISVESSVHMALQKQAFTPQGYFVKEYERIFVSHFGSNPDFKKIVVGLARHPYGLTRKNLCKITRLEESGWLSQCLYDLEMAGFIKSYTPFHSSPQTRQILYCLTDPYLMFYHTFISPNLSKIKQGADGIFLRLTSTPAYSSWLGRSFEYVCLNHAKKISALLGFSGVDYSVGPYFQSPDPGRKGMQIDLVFDRADHILLVCEIKYTQKPVGVEIIPEMGKKLALLENMSRKTIQKILITKQPPSAALVSRGFFYKIILAEELI